MNYDVLNGNQKFWLAFWAVMLAAFVVFVVSVTTYHISYDAQLASLIRDAADPIAARCSFDPAGTGSICTINGVRGI